MPSSRLSPSPGRSAPPRLRRRREATRLMLALALLAGLVAGSWLLLRDSALVAVDRVTVTGAEGPQADAVREALQAAGTGMTTLHVRPAELRAAVRPYPEIEAVEAHPDFPHGLRVRVTRRAAVGALTGPGRAVAVAADGTLLPGTPIAGLPVVPSRSLPRGARVDDRRTRAILRLLALAPAPLRAKVTMAFRGSDGLSVRLADGPSARFGPGTRLTAKWASLEAVLASSASRGATSIDVRVPEHPAAAGLEQEAAQRGEQSTYG